MQKAEMRFPLFLCAVVCVIAVWSYIHPHDRFTWWLEAIPVAIALPLLAVTYTRFRFTDFIYALIAIHCVILLIGAHYTYARVPAFDWLRDAFDLTRNHYDRVGHFAQGFIPAMIGRELVIRTTKMRGGKWLFVLLVLSALGIAALYEIIEWVAAASTGDAAENFLGTQGDVWDTQKDMALAGIGACVALICFGGIHDRALKAIGHK